MEYQDILTFWFEELTEADWYSGTEAIDRTIADRFTDVLTAARAGELWQWRTTPEGSLAEIIVLDQFSRNIFRGNPAVFSGDGQALTLAQEAVAKNFDQGLTKRQKQFLYMPYMHSESRIVHVEALRLFTELGDEGNLKYEQIHKDIIDRFGRYPHRNAQLGRVSTAEELDYLNNNEEGFFKS